MSNNWTNSLAAAAVAVSIAAPAAAAEQRFDCPEGMGYRFAYAEPEFGASAEPGWDSSIKRGKGSSAAGLPRLSVRRGAMRCQYALPHGAFVLVTRPFPEGAECTIRQDDYFDAPYFACE